MSAELRELRQRSGLRAEDVARSLGFSMSKLSRMEHGHRGLHADDVCALLGLYRVPAQRRDELLSLVRSGSDRNWWQAGDSDLSPNWRDLMRFEAEATAIYNWEPLVIPGLLQTAEYAEAVIRGTKHNVPDAEIRKFVDARISRQAVLSGCAAPDVLMLLDEMALRRPVGPPSVLPRQLEHLAHVARRSNVTVQVVPFASGSHPGIEGAYVLLEFPKHRTLVYNEFANNEVFLEEPEQIAIAKVALRRLRELALSPEDSAGLIARLADEMT